jgi:hypothetical protein
VLTPKNLTLAIHDRSERIDHGKDQHLGWTGLTIGGTLPRVLPIAEKSRLSWNGSSAMRNNGCN